MGSARLQMREHSFLPVPRVKSQYPRPTVGPVATRHPERPLLGLPPGVARAPNSLVLSWRARWVRSSEASCVICTVSSTTRTPTICPT
jgi:hypothetical protein